MAYVNFKEEKAKANIQLSKRVINNRKIREKIESDKKIVSLKADPKWSYQEFENRVFNGEDTKSSSNFLRIEEKNIICSKFISCKFYNMHFKNCSFIGCYFKNCDFRGGGVQFENCSFYLECTTKAPDLNEKENLSCEFKGCKIYGEFKWSVLNYIIFNECSIKNTSFQGSDMTGMIIKSSNLSKINVEDSDISSLKIVDTYIEDFEFNDKMNTKMDDKTFIDKIIPRKKTKAEYEGIYKVYEVFADKFNDNNLKNNFGEYYYQCKNMERKSLDKVTAKISSFVYWATCGYGERFINTIITSLIIIVIFAMMYLIFGISVNDVETSYILGKGIPTSFWEFCLEFNEAMHMSISIFTGEGPAGETSAIPISYFVSGLENIVGVIIIGVGIGAIVRKLVR